MDQLELLWKLENSKISLEEKVKELDIIKTDRRIKNLEARLRRIKKNMSDIENKISENKSILKENENLLKEYTYYINKVDKDLYGGEITDIKQLDNLSAEKDRFTTLINQIEDSMITMIDESEKQENELIDMSVQLENLNSEIVELVEFRDNISNKLKDQIIEGEDVVKVLESKIKENILNRYNVLRKTRANAIVPVRDHICSGCNMQIPTYLRDVLRGMEEIVYCESCGRILYYIAEE